VGHRLELPIIARGSARLTLAELAATRKEPPACFSAKLTPQLLKHSDEQTLASLVALYAAIADFGMAAEDFGPWGVVSLSRSLGRGAFAAVMDKYRIDGAWGVSVQVIPHRTPHAVSGTISLGLGMHGPAIGANGGPDGDATALLVLPGLFAERHWRGVWLVCSEWSPELAIDGSGRPISDSVCLATAVALANGPAAAPALGCIRLDSAGSKHSSVVKPAPHVSFPNVAPSQERHLPSLVEFFLGQSGDGRKWISHPSNSLRVEIDFPAAAGAARS